MLADLKAKVITERRVREVYGGRPSPEEFFDFGEARTRFERTWPQDVQEYLVARPPPQAR